MAVIEFLMIKIEIGGGKEGDRMRLVRDWEKFKVQACNTESDMICQNSGRFIYKINERT